MKTKTISSGLLSLGLAFVLGSTITHLHGASPPTSQDVPQLPVITIHSIDNVTRGMTGSFVLDMRPVLLLGGTYVNFSVSGTAVSGLDYVPLAPPPTSDNPATEQGRTRRRDLGTDAEAKAGKSLGLLL